MESWKLKECRKCGSGAVLVGLSNKCKKCGGKLIILSKKRNIKKLGEVDER